MFKRNGVNEELGDFLYQLGIAGSILEKHNGPPEVVRFIKNLSVGNRDVHYQALTEFIANKNIHQNYSSAEEWNKRVWAQTAVEILHKSKILKRSEAAKLIAKWSGLNENSLLKVYYNDRSSKKFEERTIGLEVYENIQFFAVRSANPKGNVSDENSRGLYVLSIQDVLLVCVKGLAGTEELIGIATKWLLEEKATRRPFYNLT